MAATGEAALRLMRPEGAFLGFFCPKILRKAGEARSPRPGAAGAQTLVQNGTSPAPSAEVTNLATTFFSPAFSKAISSLSPSTPVMIPYPNFW